MKNENEEFDLERKMLPSENVETEKCPNVKMDIAGPKDLSHDEVERHGEINRSDAKERLKVLEEKVQCLSEEEIKANNMECQNKAYDPWKKELEAKEQHIALLQEELIDIYSFQKNNDRDLKKNVEPFSMKALEAKNKHIFHMEREALHWKSMRTMHEKGDVIDNKPSINEFLKELDAKDQHIIQLETELTTYKDQKYNEMNMNIEREKALVDVKDWRIAELEWEVVCLRNAVKYSNDNTNSFEISKNNKNKEREIFLQQQIDNLKQDVLYLMDAVSCVSESDIHTIERLRDETLKINEDVVQLEEEAISLVYKFNNSFNVQSKWEKRIHFVEQRMSELEKLTELNRSVSFKSTKMKQLEEMVKELKEYIEENNIEQLKKKFISQEHTISQLEKTNVELATKLTEYNKNSAVPIEKDNHQDVDINLQNSAADQDSQRINRLQEMQEVIRATDLLLSEKDKIISEQKQLIDACNSAFLTISDENLKLEEKSGEFRLKYEIEMRKKEHSEGVEELQIKEMINNLLTKDEIAFNLDIDIAQEIVKTYDFKRAFHRSIIKASERKKKLECEKMKNHLLVAKIDGLENQISLLKDTSAVTCSNCEMLRSQLKESLNMCFRYHKEGSHIKRYTLKSLIPQREVELRMLEYMRTRNKLLEEEVRTVKQEMLDLVNLLRTKNEHTIRCFEIMDESPTSMNFSDSNLDVTKDNSADDNDDLDSRCEDADPDFVESLIESNSCENSKEGQSSTSSDSGQSSTSKDAYGSDLRSEVS